MDVKKLGVALEQIADSLYGKKKIVNYQDLSPGKSALVVIDMVNGFTKEGLLQSPRVQALVPEVVDIIEQCKSLGMPIIAFADSHPENCPEFSVHGIHCQEGGSEAEIVEEIKEVGGYSLIKKNSTNGFLEPEFQDWLKENPQITNFIVIGDCTDICILQFTLTLKAHFNRLNQTSWIGVPINAVDTFDFGLHNGDLMQLMGLQIMLGNGIDVFTGFES